MWLWTILLTFGATSLLVILYGLRNLYWHPLARFPGPLLWRAYRLPFLVSMMSGRLPRDIQNAHERYGPVLRVAPNELSFSDPVWSQIYAHRAGQPPLERPAMWRGRFPLSQAKTLITALEADHSRIRRVLKTAFSERALREQEPLMQSCTTRLITRLRDIVEQARSLDGVELDITKWITYATFDIIGELTFGESFRCLEEDALHPWIGIGLQFRAALFEAAIDHYPLLSKLVHRLTPKSALKPVYDLLEITRDKLERRLQVTEPRGDFMKYILDQNSREPPETKVSAAEIELNSMLIAVAGSDTVATSLAAAIYFLLTNQQSHERLVTEIRSRFSNECEMNAASLRTLPYLDAVAKETLRLCPPSADGARREIPTGGRAIGGYYLPEGTIVSVAPMSCFMSETNFTKARSFCPERWTNHEGPSFFKDHSDALQPFLLGNRECLGQQMAWEELRLILARLLWNFDFRIATNGIIDWYEQKIFFNWEKDPLIVKISLA